MSALAWNRPVWMWVAAILVLGPAVFNLARQDEFTSSVPFTPTAVGPYGKVVDPAYYRGLLDDGVLRRNVEQTVGKDADLASVTIDLREGTADLLLTARGDSPMKAYALANGAAHQLGQATRRALAAEAQRTLSVLRPLAGAKGRGPVRRRIAREIAVLDALGALPPPRIFVQGPGPPPGPRHAADELVDALPGRFPGRPSPFWAAVAGLIVTAALWGIAFVLGRPRHSR